MGIHYDYKNTRGAKKLQKQHEREQRRLSKKPMSSPNNPIQQVNRLNRPKSKPLKIGKTPISRNKERKENQLNSHLLKKTQKEPNKKRKKHPKKRLD